MFIVAGTTNVDLFVRGVDRMPVAGQDEFTTDNLAFCDVPLQMVLGGNGGNTAYVLARLGAPVQLYSAIGQDRLGDVILDWLHVAGVDTAGLHRSPVHATSSTTIVTDAHRHRLSFHHRGASAHFEDVVIPEGVLGRASTLLVTSYTLLLGWRPGRIAAVLAAARRRKVVTGLDVGPAIGEPVVLSELASLLPDVDYLFCNEHELAVCTGTADVEASLGALFEAGARCLVLKRGRRGATVCTPDGRLDVPGFDVPAPSTIGAGDAFDAGFLFGVQQAWPPAQAARFANAVAALVVRRARGGLGAPSLADVHRFFEETTTARASGEQEE